MIEAHLEQAAPIWKRSSPVLMVRMFFLTCLSIAKRYVELGGLSALIYSATNSVSVTIISVISGVLMLSFTAAFIAYVVFKYRIYQDRFEMVSGIIRKNHVIVPFAKVQQLSTEKPFYYGFWDVVDVTLETAGTDTAEVIVPALGREEVACIERLVNSKKQAEQTTSDGLDGSEDNEFISLSWLDLVKHGLCRNKLLWCTAVAVGLYQNAKPAITAFVHSPSANALAERLLLDQFTPGTLAIFAAALGVVVFLLACMAVSIALSLVNHWSYSLVKVDDGYQCASGLFSKRVARSQTRRIQWIVVSQNVFERYFDAFNVAMQQLGSRLTIPTASKEDVVSLLNDAMPGNSFDHLVFKRGHVGWYIKRCLCVCLPILLVALFFGAAIGHTAGAIVTATIAVMFGVFFYLRWRRFGFSHDERFYYIKIGGLDSKCYVMDKSKLQSWKYVTSPILNKFGLCTIRLYFGPGAFSLNWISQSDGEKLIRSGIMKIEDKLSWL